METIKEYLVKYKELVLPICVVVCSVIILSLVIIPQFFSYLTVQEKISSLKNRSQFLEAKTVELESFDEAQIKKNFETVFQFLPSEQDISQSIVNLVAMLHKAGLSLKNIAYVTAPFKDKEAFQFTLTVVGSIDSLRNFLVILQEAPQLFQVDSMAVRFVEGKEIEADIPILVFYQKKPTDNIKLDQPVPKLQDQENQLLAKLEKAVTSFFSSESTLSATPSALGKLNPFE